MSDYTVTYNGITDKNIGCHAKKRPSIPAPTQKVYTTDLRGMDGAYYDTDGTYNDIVIDVTFSFTSADRSAWQDLYRAIKKWLLSSGDKSLKFSDDEPYFYKVKNVSLTTERRSRIIGEVTATFTCDGYSYREDGNTEIQLSNNMTITNEYDACHPIYRVTGSGTITLQLNDESFIVTVNGEAFIDTEKMIVYNTDNEWVNFTAQGDYEDLWLKPGDNNFSYTAATAMTVYMTPRWRCL